MAFVHRPSKGCTTIITVIALAFCVRILMTGVFGLIDVGNVQEAWIKVDALVVGRNTTTFGSVYGELYYCARVEFLSHLGENITAISNTDCVLDAWTIVVGSSIPILYNPGYPTEFIEQEVLQKQLDSHWIIMSVGAIVSVILIVGICRILEGQRPQPPPILVQNEWNMSARRPTESPEERKERILSKLYLVTIPEESNKIAASSIRSMRELGPSDTTTEGSEDSECGFHGNEEEEKNKDEKEVKSENDILEQTQEDSTTVKVDKPQGVSSTISSFWSKLIRPNQDIECCICLDRYEPGEVVCASKSEECNHVFHKECLMDWMMKNNDSCPLCRVDFLKAEDVEEA